MPRPPTAGLRAPLQQRPHCWRLSSCSSPSRLELTHSIPLSNHCFILTAPWEAGPRHRLTLPRLEEADPRDEGQAKARLKIGRLLSPSTPMEGPSSQTQDLLQRFATGGDFALQGYWAMSVDIYGCHNWEGECYWHLVGRGHWCRTTFYNAQDSPSPPPTKNCPAPKYQLCCGWETLPFVMHLLSSYLPFLPFPHSPKISNIPNDSSGMQGLWYSNRRTLSPASLSRSSKICNQASAHLS